MIGVAAGLCGTLFLGYCIYFDHKRRNDPNFKKMLRERRKAAREASNKRSIPNLRDSDEIQRFFLQEVQLGEELLGQGDVNNGVLHLANAVEVCGQPQQLLNVLSTTLPPGVFDLLVQKLTSSSRDRSQKGAAQMINLAEEDVE